MYNKSVEIKLNTGFTQEKEYYEPKYPSFLNDTFNNFGALYWKSNIVIEPKSSVTINIYKHYQKEIKAFIEGLDEDGRLFSKSVLLF
jgi:hypothetical protein